MTYNLHNSGLEQDRIIFKSICSTKSQTVTSEGEAKGQREGCEQEVSLFAEEIKPLLNFR